MSDEITVDTLLKEARSHYPEYTFSGVEISSDDLVFEQRVLFNCFYCGRYGNNWKCPPNLPSVDYSTLFSEYKHLVFIWVDIPFNKNNYNEVRSDSSVVIHRALLKLESYLWQHDNSTALSFIGGSCKLCKNGCGEKRCNNPYNARSPLEATGLNIVETAKKYDLLIEFPPKDSMLRLGLIAW